MIGVCNLQGCHAKVSDFMKENFNIVGGVAIAFSFIQVSLGYYIECKMNLPYYKTSRWILIPP